MSIVSTQPELYPMEGGCPCGQIRYRMEKSPLIIHCCHCTWCQRESGTAFALNAIIETENLTLLSSTSPKTCPSPAPSGTEQVFYRCPTCFVAVWSEYGGTSLFSMIRVGTLDGRKNVKPGVQIYTSTKMDWVDLSKEECKVFEEYYPRQDVWGKESMERMVPIVEKMKASQKEQSADLEKH